MEINRRLTDLEKRGLADKSTIEIVLRIRKRLSDYWQADVGTPLVATLLFHLACALGRVQRGYSVSPLYREFMEEIESAVYFSHISMINADLMHAVPFPVPEEEQTYFLANIYSLLLEQPWILDKNKESAEKYGVEAMGEKMKAIRWRTREDSNL